MCAKDIKCSVQRGRLDELKAFFNFLFRSSKYFVSSGGSKSKRDSRLLSKRTIFTGSHFGISRFYVLLAVFTIAYWVLVSYPVLGQVTYSLPSDYLGSPSSFIAGFKNDIGEKFNTYMGLLVSFVGVRYVLRAFLG